MIRKRLKKQRVSDGIGLSFGLNRTEKLDAFIKCGFAQSKALKNTVALVAIGGYGRAEMSPGSDIDLIAYHESPLSAAARRELQSINGWAWPDGHALSLLVHDSESLGVLLAQDVPALTSLLDRRLIAGSKKLYREMDAALEKAKKTHGADRLIAAKLDEQEQRHKKFGDSRYDLQPNVKEGKGALRDLHTLRWLSQIVLGDGSSKAMVKAGILLRDEAERLDAAQKFFGAVRYHLHNITGTRQDRLTFESQPAVAAAMGYTDENANVRAETFMRDYFRMTQETGHLTRILCSVLEDRAIAPNAATAGHRKPDLIETAAGFTLKQNRLTVPDSKTFLKNPETALHLFRAGQVHNLDIHPDALRHLRKALPKLEKTLPDNRAAHAVFHDILCDAHRCAQTLRRLNETGVLAALIPAFANIQAHMQYDMYHTVTADEHTIRACAILHDIAGGKMAEQAPVSTAIYPKLAMPRLLHLAMFLHDIAKGGGEDHAKAGAEHARSVAPAFGLDAAETEMLAWLVENHLLMTMTAFKRDIDDAKTVDDFVAVVQSPEKLKMLTCLTVADIMAVGPNVWNSWKANLLRQLYQRAYDRMTGVPSPEAGGDLAPFLGMIEQNAKTQLVFRANPAADCSQLVVYTADAPALFSTLAGAIAAAGANIVQARIFTLSSGMVLDVFDIQGVNGAVYENEKFLLRSVRAALDGKLDIAGEIAQRRRQSRKRGTAALPPRVTIDNTASDLHTLIEVNAADRAGLLYDITQALAALGLNIHAAKVATFGRQAVDVFYVKDAFGLKILHPDRLASIEKDLIMALASRPAPDL